MKKKIIRAKRSQQDIIQFIEGLPNGMVKGGKASDLVDSGATGEEAEPIPIDIHEKKDRAYLVDVVLGLNEDKD